ncbi:Rha family transcriptional regulator [Moritella sp. JT01]|uniref:Rha family transcriptional regulator n=1 Tax=Moritella sp. JT01 TaxID=756698 RepID=UPI00082A1874|nr:Rha family transcriptional regulator [Moritella sp. JT01]
MSSITIQLNVPYCTKKKYAAATGQSISAIDQAVANGKLPIWPKESKNSGVLINLVALFKKADAQQFV